MDPTSVERQWPTMMTAEETGEFLRVRRPKVYQLFRSGVLPGVRVGRKVRFNRDQLVRWIASGGAPARTAGTEV